jgi:hypothetical protein
MKEDDVIRFGVHGLEMKSFIHACLNRRRVWRLPCSGIVCTPEGEVVYDSEIGNYTPCTYSEGERQKIRRILGTNILKAVRGIADDKFGWDGWDASVSPAKIRSFKKRDEPLGIGECPHVTLGQAALLAELLMGYKTKPNIKKCYTEAEIEAVIGHAADPFTTAAVQNLEEELKQMKAGRDTSVSAMRKKHREEEDALVDMWNARIKEAEAKITALRAAAMGVSVEAEAKDAG